MRKVFKTEENVSLNEFLRARLESLGASNSKIRRLIVSGAVKVNGRTVTRPAFELRGKSEVECFIDEEKLFYEKQPDDIDFTLTSKDVLYEDDAIIIVNKPAFLPVEQTITGNRRNLHDCVVDYLFENEKKIHPNIKNPPYCGIMHRLDRETSGVILFTKQRATNKSLFEQFEKHTIQKTYLAVCTKENKAKVPEKGKVFAVDFPMGRISQKSQAAKWGNVPENRGGVPSHTDFSLRRTLKLKGNDALLMECKPRTGRTHQIRVHLASLGLPILGDEIYGGRESERIMLHARSLEFVHPLTGQKMCVESADFDSL